jgi:flagellin
VLEAADKGLTSLTKLVQSAKSAAQQARQATLATASYAAVNATGSVAGTESVASAQGADLSPRAIGLSFTTQTETTGTLTGTSTLDPKAISLSFGYDAETLGSTGNGQSVGTVTNATAYSFSFNGEDVSFTTASTNFGDLLTGLQGAFATAATNAGLTAGTDVELVANADGNGFSVNALRADVDITIADHSTLGNNSGLANGAYNSTSLLDNIGGSGQSLTIASTGNTNQCRYGRDGRGDRRQPDVLDDGGRRQVAEPHRLERGSAQRTWPRRGSNRRRPEQRDEPRWYGHVVADAHLQQRRDPR